MRQAIQIMNPAGKTVEDESEGGEDGKNNNYKVIKK